MRLSLVLVSLLPAVAVAQPEEAIKAVQQKVETLEYIRSLQAPGGGFYSAAQDPAAEVKPQASLRATNAAVRSWKYVGGEKLGKKLPNKDKHAAFVLKYYDPNTGAFGEPGGKPDVTTTCIGVMVAAELGIPHEKYAKAMDYIKENAKTFEQVRLGAAAVEAWGVKECPFDLKPWQDIMASDIAKKLPAMNDGGARIIGSVTAFTYRLGLQQPNDTKPEALARFLDRGQLADGGWNKQGEKSSDIETTYRVMRAYMLLKQKPKDEKKLREFIAARRNKDGGYATEPGGKSSISGVYYCTIILHWLDELDGK